MTIHYPDVSNHQGKMPMDGAAAIVAKASEGTTFRDSTYAHYKAEAQRLGIPFAGYHWLNSSDVRAQAQLAFSMVGPGVGLMIDDEDVPSGFDINRTLRFVEEYRRLGGIVTLEYLPQWFWRDHSSRPSLVPLQQAGLALVSSNYTTYSDSGPGWAAYGGVAPAIWQYTSTKPFNGKNIDFNAFKGTVQELGDLFIGRKREKRQMAAIIKHKPTGHVFRFDTKWVKHLANDQQVNVAANSENITPVAYEASDFQCAVWNFGLQAYSVEQILALADVPGGIIDATTPLVINNPPIDYKKLAEEVAKAVPRPLTREETIEAVNYAEDH